MNPTQLRILFDWSRTYGKYAGNDLLHLLAELVEAGGLPKPDIADLKTARDLLQDANRIYYDATPDGYDEAAVEQLMRRYDVLTADWTVTP